jgi:hypothetical protein
VIEVGNTSAMGLFSSAAALMHGFHNGHQPPTTILCKVAVNARWKTALGPGINQRLSRFDILLLHPTTLSLMR